MKLKLNEKLPKYAFNTYNFFENLLFFMTWKNFQLWLNMFV